MKVEKNGKEQGSDDNDDVTPCSETKKYENKEFHFNDDELVEEKELHIAPMLDFSKREFRKLFSILSKRVCLWTDMIVDETIAHSKRLDDLLGCKDDSNNNNNMYVCQIGGNSPSLCGDAVKVVLSSSSYDYDEINLNMDCPSNRVSTEREFGAILMKKVDVAYNVLFKMKQQQEQIEEEEELETTTDEGKRKKKKYISVKCRIGVDDDDSLDFICGLVAKLEPVCQRFYIHARKCILNSEEFNARKNRSIPPLNYPRVYDLCRKYPNVTFWINGGIRSLRHAKEICYGRSNNNDRVPNQLCSSNKNGSCTIALSSNEVPPNLRGCMLGRAAIDNPALFWDVDRYFYGMKSNPCRNRREVLEKYCIYLEEELYPRRCCDDDDRITYEIPVPIIKERYAQYCPMCQSTYVSPKQTNEQHNNTNDSRTGSRSSIPIHPTNTKIKIHPRIMGRALKPVQNMFYGLPGGRTFFKISDELIQNKALWNCGPGFILRKTMQSMPNQNLLNQDFIKTEEL